MVVLPWGAPVVPANQEEEVLLAPLLAHLQRTKRVRPDTIVKLEFPWNGRRVDLASLSATLIASAYELKLSSAGRAIEQAAYNRLSFDRSWVVTAGWMKPQLLDEASILGIGVLALVGDRLVTRLPAKRQARASSVIRARLLRELRAGRSASV